MEKLPTKQPALRVLPMPADANQNGDIFGGWIMSQVDIAGGVVAGLPKSNWTLGGVSEPGVAVK